MRDFRSLQVWEKSHQLALSVYKATTSFPKEELYALTSQLRRSSTSIPINIAEGCGRDSPVALANFMQIAMGSASEVEYTLLLTHDLGYLEANLYQILHQDVIEVKRMLAAFIQKLKADR
jgi:four helix bundle protein